MSGTAGGATIAIPDAAGSVTASAPSAEGCVDVKLPSASIPEVVASGDGLSGDVSLKAELAGITSPEALNVDAAPASMDAHKPEASVGVAVADAPFEGAVISEKKKNWKPSLNRLFSLKMVSCC